MSSKTKIFVLRMKEVIYAGIFAALGILLIILLIFMFAPKNKTTKTSAEPAKYTPGIYTASLILNDQAIDVEVAVNSDTIQSVRFVNLEDAIATMYPLMAPAMEHLAAQVVENQGISGVSYDESSQYTSMAILRAIGTALDKAIVSE